MQAPLYFNAEIKVHNISASSQVAPIPSCSDSSVAKDGLSDAGGPRFESPAGRVTRGAKSTPKPLFLEGRKRRTRGAKSPLGGDAPLYPLRASGSRGGAKPAQGIPSGPAKRSPLRESDAKGGFPSSGRLLHWAWPGLTAALGFVRLLSLPCAACLCSPLPDWSRATASDACRELTCGRNRRSRENNKQLTNKERAPFLTNKQFKNLKQQTTNTTHNSNTSFRGHGRLRQAQAQGELRRGWPAAPFFIFEYNIGDLLC